MTDGALDLIRREVVEAFAGTSRPDLSDVRPLGCCEEHEEDYEWYRSHSVEEFADILPSDSLYPYNFAGLHPLAYHYFVPGILLAALDSPAARDPEAPSWGEYEWVDHLLPYQDSAARFRSEYLPLFGRRQRRAVADFLRLWFADELAEDPGPPKTEVLITNDDWDWDVRLSSDVPGSGREHRKRVEAAVNRIWPDET
jgi:hypothetical protein